MPEYISPAIAAFVDQLPNEFVFGQVLIRQNEKQFELRHVADRAASPESLRKLVLSELRPLVQTSKSGAFRPLKSAPTLPNGWRSEVHTISDLDFALGCIYPGAVADWYSVRTGRAEPTSYRDFTNRQTGMYRITQKLSDEGVARVVRSGCNQRFCLRQRLWTVPGLETDNTDEKSVIPCLEPCAVLLEFARKAMRIEQEDRIPVEISESESATVFEGLSQLLEQNNAQGREADISVPGNARRVALLLEKLKAQLVFKSPSESE